MRPRPLLLLGLLMLPGACGEGKPPLIGLPFLRVVNKSQFPLLQLILHRRVDDHVGKPNLLEAPLQPERQIMLGPPTVQTGSYFLTAVREKVTHGALVAVTTAQALELVDGEYLLWVFDESFRLWPPAPRPDAGADRGPPDLAPRERAVGDRLLEETAIGKDLGGSDAIAPDRSSPDGIGGDAVSTDAASGAH